MQPILLIGAGGFAGEVVEFLADIAAGGRALRCEAVIVEKGFAQNANLGGLPVVEGLDSLRNYPGAAAVIVIGAAQPRRRIAETVDREFHAQWVGALVHPSAFVGRKVSIGPGSIIAPLASATTNISIGRHVQLHTGAAVGHDCRIGDFVTMSPRSVISGRVEIGEGAFIGAGAVVLPDLKIGAWSVVGAGAIVTKDVAPNSTVVGNPARVLS